jgi:uncharacterized membrane protein
MPLTHAGEQVISISLFISFVSVLVGMLAIGLAIPLIRGKIPMNDTYGLRIPKSFTSEENWYKLNTFGGKIMIAFLALPLILFGIVCVFLPFSSVNELMIAFLSVMIFSVALCLYFIFQFSNKLS